MTYDELKAQLDEEYDRATAETLSRLKKIKPLTKQKLAKALFEANKAYWAARLALIDADMVYEAERTAAALAVPYANAMETFAGRVRNIYAGYQSAFDLSKKDAKELLEKVRYDRTIAENLRTIAEGMPDGEDKTRILAEISAPAYRYRLQRAEKMSEQAKEVCDAIARGEIRTDRALFQTQTEKAYNITLDEITNGREPAGAVLDAITPEPEQLRILEMPRGGAPIEDFSPTTDRGVLDSFSLINSKAVKEITERDWSGSSFSDSVWSNTDELAREIKQVLLEGELTGASEADMADKIRERFGVAMYKARRVVRTESDYCVNQAELKGMRDAGYDEYQFMSLHEERDCETCDDLDGEVFRIADAAVGVNCPPIHPFCRCKVTTKEKTLEDIQREIDERIASWNIPEGMSLDEFIDRVNNGELEQIRAEQAEKAAEGVDNSDNLGIIEENDKRTMMQEICKIDTSIYSGVTDKHILTDEVILTPNREEHIIERRGQEFYDTYRPYFAEILTSPDYIFPDKSPDTAIVSKTYIENNKTVNVILRLAVEGDNPSYKNSIISAIGEGKDRFEQRLRNNTPIYKRLDK